MPSSSTASSTLPTAAPRLRRFLRRAAARRCTKPLVRVDGWEQHRHRGVDLTAALVESPRGPLRSHHPAPARRGPHRHRPVRAGAHAAVEPGRARRPLLPGLPELALPVHRREGAAGGADGARRGRRRRGVHPPPRRVRARLDARARHASRRPRRPARREIESRPARAPHPLDRGLHRPRLGRARDARALERRQPPDHDLRRG